MKIFTHLDEKCNKFIATTIFFYVHYFNQRKKILKKPLKVEQSQKNLSLIWEMCRTSVSWSMFWMSWKACKLICQGKINVQLFFTFNAVLHSKKFTETFLMHHDTKMYCLSYFKTKFKVNFLTCQISIVSFRNILN